MIKVRAFLIVAALSAVALAEDAPDLKTILDKNVEASGGREKLDSVKNMSMSAEVTMPAQNLTGKLAFDRRPDAVRIQIEFPGIGVVKYGLKGDIAYEMSDLMGARLLSDDERRQLLDGIDPQTDVNRINRLADPVISRDADSWKVEGKNPTGAPEAYWFDAADFKLVKSRMMVIHQMGKFDATAVFSNFKTIDGVTVPTTIHQSTGPAVMVVTVKDLKINPELPDDRFTLPPEVVKLAAKRAAATTQPEPKP